MNLLIWALSQLLSYSLFTWLAFIALAFSLARYGGLLGMFGGHFIVAIIILVLDVRWVTAAMRAPEWDGTPDIDIIFYFGVISRILLINTTLLLVTVWALRVRKQARVISNEPNAT